jgi:hyperosmotically inducible protein
MQARMKIPAMVAAAVMFVAGCTATRTSQTAGEVIDDSAVTAQVKSALIADPVTKARQINVETYRGVVQLGGFVDTANEKDRATQVARDVNGVKEVRNDLRVSTPQSAGQAVDDATVTTEVKAKLVGDPLTKAHHINVETQKGVVQLTGFVNSAAEKTRAGELARTVDGVASLRNDLYANNKKKSVK